jgi:hypothetical protein
MVLRLFPRGQGRGPAERLAKNHVLEWWVQKYISAHHERLGFAEVEGPNDVGPDFRVKHDGKWYWAEAEIRWRGYLAHKHHENPAFNETHFLIVLSDDQPAAKHLPLLPPKIVWIDRLHFGEWYASACADYAKSHQPGSKITMRCRLIAGAMNEHWLTICPDTDREMASCPDCNSCAYFDRPFEAANIFWRMATDYAFSRCLSDDPTPGNEIDLTKVSEPELREFVEANWPNGRPQQTVPILVNGRQKGSRRRKGKGG